MNEEEKINNILNALSKSKFRSKFHIKEKEIKYIEEKGIETIEEHAHDLIRKRLAPAEFAIVG